MDDLVDFDDQWLALLASLPSGFDLDGTARSLGAFDRARQVKDPAALLRLALVYGGCGMSLRQTCAWAAETGLAEISDPALLKRLRNAQAWLAGLTQAMLSERIALQEHSHQPRRLCAVDATTLKLIRSYAIPGGPDDMEFAPDGKIWITRRFAETVAVLDPVSGKFDTIDVGRSPHGLYLNPRGPSPTVVSSR